MPVPSSALHAGLSGPYVIESKLCYTDYVVKTPNRKWNTRICHVIMLKLYFSQSNPEVRFSGSMVSSLSAVYITVLLAEQVEPFTCVHLPNSEWLTTIQSKLAHLSEPAQQDWISLVKKYPSIVFDTSSRTTVLKQDLDVGENVSVKQKAATDYLVENGLAVPSWSSPCLLVPKPDKIFLLQES